MNQVIPFMYGAAEVKTININNEPWFLAKDICDVVDIKNTAQALDGLDEDEKLVYAVHISGQSRDSWFVNEPGLYTLIIRSRKPEAKKFKRWITHEVIPSIRKHGAYMTDNTIEKVVTDPDFLIQLANALKLEQTARKAAEQRALEQERTIKEQETPVAIYNLAIAANNSMSMQEVAKSLNTGRTRLYRILREEGIIMKDSTLPYQRYIEAGYFKVVERPRASGDSIVNDPATRVMAKGFDFIARLLQKIANRNQNAI